MKLSDYLNEPFLMEDLQGKMEMLKARYNDNPEPDQKKVFFNSMPSTLLEQEGNSPLGSSILTLD